MDSMRAPAPPWSTWWRKRDFLLPPIYGGHKHAWVYVDAGVVGCRLCGVVHVCELGQGNVVPCELEYTDEGSCVCALTALELRRGMFMDEQLDVESYNRNRGATYAVGSSDADRNTKNFHENVQTISDTVRGVVHLLLFSETAKGSQRDELERYCAKTSSALAQYNHMSRGSTEQADMLLALEYVVSTTRLSRVPALCAVLPREAHLNTLCMHLIIMVQELRIVSMNALRVSPERIKHFAVGMLYVFTHGLAARGRMLVPPHSELVALLPLQVALADRFGLHPKIITESENMAKRILNEMSSSDFERLASRLAHLTAPACPYSPARGGCVCVDQE